MDDRFMTPWTRSPDGSALFSADGFIPLSCHATGRCGRSGEGYYACSTFECTAVLHLPDDAAEMILTAVNSHAALKQQRDELLAALRRLTRDDCGCYPRCQCDTEPALRLWKQNARDIARVAIAHAEGTGPRHGCDDIPDTDQRALRS